MSEQSIGYELVNVRAKFFQPGDTAKYEALLAMEQKMMVIDEPEAGSIWDALEDGEITGGAGVFATSVIVFEFSFIAPPGINTGMNSCLEQAQALGGIFESDLERIEQIARQHYQPQDATMPNECVFTLVYHCGLNFDEWAFDVELLGELDFEKLPLAVMEDNRG